jgi:hypothetical protein
MSIEAMKQALQALEHDNPAGRSATITALRQAIEQAEKQEPVAWLIQYSDRHEFVWGKKPEFLGKTVLAAEPLYTAPVHASDILKERVDETAKREREWAMQKMVAENERLGLYNEPVAWIKKDELAYMSASAVLGVFEWKTNLGLKPEPGDVPLYTAPLPPIYTTPIPPSECQTEEEKRAFAFGWWKAMEKKKQWVGLTDEEIKEIVGPWGETPIKGYTRKLFDAIEAKLREKNT